eukprot:maker-scaffold_21-snap-gene-4.44-mRNA-1 protein AED:0.05 eAED:0.08 QI:0/0/0.5/1/1/1/2/184/370
MSECEFDTNCPASEDYGWKGEDCLEYGPQSYLLFTIFAITVPVALYLLFLCIYFLGQHVSTKFRTTQCSSKVTIICGKEVFLSNFFMSKALLMYLNFFIILFIILSECFTLANLVNPAEFGKVTVDHNKSKKGDFSIPRDVSVHMFFSLVFWLFLQISLLWLHFGYTAALDPNSKKIFKRFQICIVSFQLSIPIMVIIMVAFTYDAYVIIVLTVPLYLFEIAILHYAKNKFNKPLIGTPDEGLRYQGKILHEVFCRLCISFTVFEVFAIPVIIFLYVVPDPSEYKLVVPPEGEINLFFSGAQILRSWISLYITYVVIVYLDKARNGPKTKKRIHRKVSMLNSRNGLLQTSSSENPIVFHEQSEAVSVSEV